MRPGDPGRRAGRAGAGDDRHAGNRVGCCRQTVILLEQERYAPSLLLALRIAGVFGTTVDAIFALDDPC